MSFVKRNTVTLLTFVAVFLIQSLHAQVATQYGYRIYLSDKNNSPFSIQHPEAFLSTRAIEKRQRFQIPITEEDLPVNPQYVTAIRQIDNAFQIWTQSKWTNTITLFCSDTTRLSVVRQLAFVDSICSIDNYYHSDYVQTTRQQHHSTELLERADTNFYGVGYRQIALHNGHLLHNEGFRGEGMLIAVIDAGWTAFNTIPELEDLFNTNRIAGTYDVLQQGGGVYNMSGHGTSCTSTIAYNIAYDMVGTAPEATFAFIRTEDVRVERLFEEDFLARGIEIADSIGADIISLSLSYTNFDIESTHPMNYSSCDGHWSIASQAATKGAHKGMVVCVAAGNEGLESWGKLGRPSDAEDILCVGAVNVDSLHAPFSGSGPSYDGRIKPDVVACGWDTYVMNTNGNVIPGNGTSFATPIIAGLSACLWQAIPQLSSIEIMQAIRESGHQYNQPDNYLGYGIPNFYRAWQRHHCDGLKENLPTSAYHVYPNPCRTHFTVTNPETNYLQMSLFNSMGRCIYTISSSNDSQIQINLPQQKSGLYLLKILDNSGKTEIKEIIVIGD